MSGTGSKAEPTPTFNNVTTQDVGTAEIPEDQRPFQPGDLVASFQHRFGHREDLPDVVKAVSALQQSIGIHTQSHLTLPVCLLDLGDSLQSHFDQTGDLAYLDEAIVAFQGAVNASLEQPGHVDCLTKLGNAFQRRFQHSGCLTDIAESINAQRRAVRLVSDDHADLPGWLTNLGNSLHSRFEYSGDLLDLVESIASHRRAVQLTHEGDAFLPATLGNLAVPLQSRFKRTGDIAYLAEAISVLQKAVHLTPEGHSVLPTLLTGLGNSFQSRFHYSGDLSDISEAISAHQRAVQLTHEGHPGLPGMVMNLGTSFSYRFQRGGDLSDIAEAISAHQIAVKLTPQGHASLPSRLSSLGNSFQSRFQRTGDLADIAEAISAHHRAVQLTPDGHAYLPGWLTNLGNSFQCRFNLTGDQADIAEAISAHRRAVQLTPEGDAFLPSLLANLGVALQASFQRSEDLNDISEAVSSHEKAVLLTPSGHADLPRLLRNLGNSLCTRAISNDSSNDLEASISHLRSAAMSSTGTPRIRFKAATAWARIVNVFRPQSVEVVKAFDSAIRLLALIAGLEQTVAGRYSQLEDAGSVVLDAAAAACRLGQLDRAVEWLEQGRCLVWNQLNNLRTPLEDLQAHDIQLAQRVADISKQLESAASTRSALDPSMGIDVKISIEDEASSHLALAKEWDDLLLTVRSTPGFESFLLPSPCSTLLQGLPDSGHIVVINVSKERCDAIALSTGCKEPLHIPLSNFSLAKANKYRHDLNTQLQSMGIRMRDGDVEVETLFPDRAIVQGRKKPGNTVIRNVLRALWDEVAKPILAALDYPKHDTAAGGAIPRIWWCPTGIMSFLPIHAAGLYGEKPFESLLDYAASSYTPTVTALTNRVKNCQPIDAAVSGLFLTSQPKAPGVPAILETVREVRDVCDMACARQVRSLKIETDLTDQECLERMQEHSSIHLACHASQNAQDPLQSHFILHAGTLELRTIIQTSMKNADLAFLSACHTSAGKEKLSDEAVHLAAGMLAAGYRRVVATMWSIKDQYAPGVARDFYEYLWGQQEGGIGVMDGTMSAYALHHAVQRLRQQIGDSESSLVSWVPYVHFGY